MLLQDYAKSLFNRRLLAILILGFASGLPLALTGQAMQAWLTIEKLDVTTIGMFALVGMPYTYKFLWAPLMDRFEPPLLGRRRGWMFCAQIGIAAVLFAMSTLSPANETLLFAGAALLIAFLSASQDVVIDAYRTELVAQEERGNAAALGVLGYRIAMLLSGGVAFMLADAWKSWSQVYMLMACIMLLVAGYTLISPKLVQEDTQSAKQRSQEFWLFMAMIATSIITYWAINKGLTDTLPTDLNQSLLTPVLATLAAIAAAAATGILLKFSAYRDVLGFGFLILGGLLGYALAVEALLPLFNLDPASKNPWEGLACVMIELAIAITGGFLMAKITQFKLLITPMQAYFSRQHAWAFLLLIIFYKLGDAFAGSLTVTFLKTGVGFSQTEIGLANKVIGLFATLIGAIIGGIMMSKMSLWRSLMVFGILQAVTNLGYWLLAVKGQGYLGGIPLSVEGLQVFFGSKPLTESMVHADVLLLLSVLLENLAGGMGTAALVAFLMALCSDKHATATQFALLSALAAIGRVYVGPSSGYISKAWGWPDFFLFSIVVAIPGLILLWVLKKAVDSLEAYKPKGVILDD